MCTAEVAVVEVSHADIVPALMVPVLVVECGEEEVVCFAVRDGECEVRWACAVALSRS